MSIPLVPLLEAMGDDPRDWGRSPAADALDALGILRHMIEEVNRPMVNGQEAGTALGFNVNRDGIG